MSEKTKFDYRVNQIETLTDGGIYGYSIQVNCNANGDHTTWMNITKEELEKIKEILRERDTGTCYIGDEYE